MDEPVKPYTNDEATTNQRRRMEILEETVKLHDEFVELLASISANIDSIDSSLKRIAVFLERMELKA